MGSRPQPEVNAVIHHYFHVEGVADVLDEHGEARRGFYFEFLDNDDASLGPMVGPYGQAMDAEAACQAAYLRGDY